MKARVAADILRDTVGNPFKPVRIEPAWRTRDVVMLAESAYRDRKRVRPHDDDPTPWEHRPKADTSLRALEEEFEARLRPVRGTDGTMDPMTLIALADALEEAGCGNEELLRHLRGYGPHTDCEGKGGYLATGKPLCLDANCDGWRPLPAPHYRGCWAVDLVLGRE